MTKATMRSYREASAKNSAHAALIKDCLETIERLQSFTRRGETPSEPEELPHPSKVKGKADPRIEEFKLAWVDYFEMFHKKKYLYKGAQDTQAIKRLLNIDNMDALLDLAWKAWLLPDKFNCKQAATIAGFASRYNDIVLELKTINNGGRPARTEPAGVTL